MAFMAGQRVLDQTLFDKTTAFLEDTQFATEGQTAFNLPFVYAAGMGNINVLVNGTKVLRNVDYVETDDTSVTFNAGLNLNDEVTFQIYRTSDIQFVGSGVINKELLSGDGITTDFILTKRIGPKTNIDVYINGVYQQTNTYTVSESTLSFSDAPIAGTDNIEVQIGDTAPVGETDAALVTFDVNATYPENTVGYYLKQILTAP